MFLIIEIFTFTLATIIFSKSYYTVPRSSYLNLSRYLVLEGLAYRITPFDWEQTDTGSEYGDIDTDRMYANMMNYKYGGLDNPDLYLDETTRRMCLTLRRTTVQLATQLYTEGKKDKALDVLLRINEGISHELYPLNEGSYYGVAPQTANLYLVLGKDDKAREVLQATCNNYMQQMRWYLSMNRRNLYKCESNFLTCVKEITRIAPLMEECFDKTEIDEIKAELESMCNEYDILMQ